MSVDSIVAKTRVASPGLVWTAVLAVAWLALALWQPTTTWHLAPVLLAAAWPWVVGQDLVPGDATQRPRIVVAGLSGLAIVLAETGALAAADLLRGPTLTGSGSAITESAILGALGALLATLAGLLRTRLARRPAQARVGDTVIASSEAVVFADATAYFPLADVADGVLTPSSTVTVCPWKGIARYYDVHVGDEVLNDGAWHYPRPFPFARRVKGRVAFWPGLEVIVQDKAD